VSNSSKEPLIHLIKEGEGSIEHMYLDTVAKVTVGVGNMLPSVSAAQELPFLQKSDDTAASAADIAADFENVARQSPGKIASSYQSYTQLYLPEDAVNALLDKRIDGFEAQLVRDFPGYSDYPEDAQYALMDMVFNLGNRGLVSKFPSLTRAARDQDWAECAAQCHRRGISDHRNEEVHALFMSAANR